MKKIMWLTIGLFYFGGGMLDAQYSVLHNFIGTQPMDIFPGQLTLNGNKIYGTTNIGGKHDSGCIFSVDINGNNYKDLFDFSQITGYYPGSPILLSGRKLYGTGGSGNGISSGVIFSIDTNGSGYKILHSFSPPPHDSGGFSPNSNLIFLRKTLFGVTAQGGGGSFDYGVIYSIDTNGANYRVLFRFNGGNGANPYGLLFAVDKLYGMTENGGSNGWGCIYSIDTNGSNFNVLFNFNGNDGSLPQCPLIISGGNIYGTTLTGGNFYNGNVITIDTSGSNYKVLLYFNDTNGKYPYGPLSLSGNRLYGTTESGGINDTGRIYSIDINGNNYRDMYDFKGIEGAEPASGLILSGGFLYGNAQTGGDSGYGVIFKIDTGSFAGVAELRTKSEEIIVYPNPASTSFTISLPQAEKANFELYNELEQRVITNYELKITASTINVSNLPEGMYFYRVVKEDGNTEGTGKIIIAR
jgi:uncharacterized repeat protein (TIGR03803 family)